MATPPQIPTQRQPLVDQNGHLTQPWYRALAALFTNSGTIASAVTVKPSAVLTETIIASGGTITAPDLPSGSVIGNSGTAVGQPHTIVAGPGIDISSGTIDLAPIPGQTLLGNPGFKDASPRSIQIGANLSLSGDTLLSADTDPDDVAILFSIRDTRGQIAAIDQRIDTLALEIASLRDARGQLAEMERQVNDALILAMLPPAESSSATISTSTEVAAGSLFGNSGTVEAPGSSIAIGANLLLSGGTLSAAGSIAASITIAAESLFGNPGAAPALGTGIAIGENLSLSTSGTLSAVGAQTFIFNQGVPAAQWTINHNLGRFPSVSVVDSAGNVVEGDVDFLSANEITVAFSAPFSGEAYLN
jgi:hypothetical protein